MTSITEGPFKTFEAAGAIPVHRVVKTDSNGKVVVAAAGTDLAIGVSPVAVASGYPVGVRMRNSGGTVKVVASAAIAKDAALAATTGGKVVTTTTANDQVVGYALQAAAADGDVIEAVLTSTKY
jgi:hypothetical protein